MKCLVGYFLSSSRRPRRLFLLFLTAVETAAGTAAVTVETTAAAVGAAAAVETAAASSHLTQRVRHSNEAYTREFRRKRDATQLKQERNPLHFFDLMSELIFYLSLPSLSYACSLEALFSVFKSLSAIVNNMVIEITLADLERRRDILVVHKHLSLMEGGKIQRRYLTPVLTFVVQLSLEWNKDKNTQTLDVVQKKTNGKPRD